MKHLLLTMVLLLQLSASDKLVFGAISTIEPDLMEKKLLPILNYLERVTGKKIVFKTGYNYTDTIEQFANAQFDIGYIGPAPYIKVKDLNPHSIDLIAGIKNKKTKPFASVIVSKKGSLIHSLERINQHTLAFGSPESTLSYYVPMSILMKTNTIKKIKQYDFLGRHDKVAQYVIMGKYDLGAIKRSIADKYSKYLQVVKQSQSMPDFVIVSNASLDPKITKKIQKALLALKDPSILHSIKKSVIGFELKKDSDYDALRKIMKEVESFKE